MKGVGLAWGKRGVGLGFLLLGASLVFLPSEGRATQFLTGNIATIKDGSAQVVVANYALVPQSVSFEAFTSFGTLFASGIVDIVPRGFSKVVVNFGPTPPSGLIWIFTADSKLVVFSVDLFSEPEATGHIVSSLAPWQTVRVP